MLSGELVQADVDAGAVKKTVEENRQQEKAAAYAQANAARELFERQTERVEIRSNAPPFKTWVFTPAVVRIGNDYIRMEDVNYVSIKEGYGLKNGVMSLRANNKTYLCGFMQSQNLTANKIREMTKK